MKGNKELEMLSTKLKNIFKEIEREIKGKNITDRTLDSIILKTLKNYEISEKYIEIKFSEPRDTIYRVEAGRTPYDLLSYGKINGKKFFVFINNKFGNLNSNARNDVTTYNNLLRLYLGIKKQRLTSQVIIDNNLIYRRIAGEEIIAYGIFVVDKKTNNSNFFLLEEISDVFYVNPRNTMFQIKYNPSIKRPIDYYSFVLSLIDAIIYSLQKNINSTKTEVVVLNSIKKQIIEIKRSENDS